MGKNLYPKLPPKDIDSEENKRKREIGKKRLKEIHGGKELVTEEDIDKLNIPETHKMLRKNVIKRLELALGGVDKEAMMGRFNDLSKLAVKEKDITNAIRGQENIARMAGYYNDKLSVDNSINPETLRQLDEIKRRVKGE